MGPCERVFVLRRETWPVGLKGHSSVRVRRGEESCVKPCHLIHSQSGLGWRRHHHHRQRRWWWRRLGLPGPGWGGGRESGAQPSSKKTRTHPQRRATLSLVAASDLSPLSSSSTSSLTLLCSAGPECRGDTQTCLATVNP